jgi:hypothetical protein
MGGIDRDKERERKEEASKQFLLLYLYKSTEPKEGTNHDRRDKI